jgi:ubiquinone/menaquinone biosynthesis C-methylase UbiE
MEQGWDSIYRTSGVINAEPYKEMRKVVELFRERGLKQVLDVGCGTGRHTVMLARQGFDVFGFDISPEGVQLTYEWLGREKLKADLHVQSMFDEFTYEDEFFDAVICVKTLNHGGIEDIRKTIAEMERVLKPGGLVFIVVSREHKVRDSAVQRKRATLLDERTLIPTQGIEAGVVHYMFNKEILLREFRHFTILACYRSGERDYSLLGEMIKKRSM